MCIYNNCGKEAMELKCFCVMLIIQSLGHKILNLLTICTCMMQNFQSILYYSLYRKHTISITSMIDANKKFS